MAKNPTTDSTGSTGSPIVPLAHPLVPCDIRIERVGLTKRGNTPYIVYVTAKGRCCTFVSRSKFHEVMLALFGIQKRPSGKILGFEIERFGINFNTEAGKHFVAESETRMFLERYNRVGLEGLQVKTFGTGALVKNPSTRTSARVTERGCNCEDGKYRTAICKHRIATHLYMQAAGWGSLEQYLKHDYSILSDEQVFALTEDAMADLGF
ncbi:MAG: hypothetical protein KME26_11895 [Oscillatoria princeps RMCB-10]|jgi:hypothetical protein|nr:hypothetical protein [Oscillatoria princeps RMCB-10]